MKITLSVFMALVASASMTQPLPVSEDYLMMTSFNNQKHANFIFKESKNVLIDYDLEAQKAGNSYKQSAKMIKELFAQADQMLQKNIKRLTDSEVTDKEADYWVIDYRKKGKTYHFVWLRQQDDDSGRQLDELSTAMGRFW